MRSAQIENNIVINFAEVSGFNTEFIDPLDSVIGSVWDGIKFNHPSYPLPSLEDYIKAITEYLDAGAKIKNYDDIKSAALRAGFEGPYKSDGEAYALWMDSCWQIGYALLAKYEAGTIQQPTIDELIAELPKCPF